MRINNYNIPYILNGIYYRKYVTICYVILKRLIQETGNRLPTSCSTVHEYTFYRRGMVHL